MTPYYDDGTCTIYHGDCRELLPGLTADAIVTDPPYGLAFMGKEWDKPTAGFHQAWATAALQALPPGGWLLAFGGTRTWHRLACGLEDAGFELRDTIMWMYGSGFPKSRACLKPGWEPVIVARRPGSGALQIDACRIAGTYDPAGRKPQDIRGGRVVGGPLQRVSDDAQECHPSGRWPANVVLTHGDQCRPVGTRKVQSAGWNLSAPIGKKLSRNVYAQDAYSQAMTSAEREPRADPDGTETVQAWDCEPDCPVALLDQQSGTLSTHGSDPGGNGRADTTNWRFRKGAQVGDSGGASRFFFTAKASRAERVTVDGEQHPCVKPLPLMRWLVRLVCPPGGTILDPFCGSGSTLAAAAMEGFQAVGIEADERWCRGSAKRVAERPPVQEALAL